MRYSRQIGLNQIGEEGQKRLKTSSALVIGAGGLGSPVLYYLAAAGVGRLGIVDVDSVDESNLNRQILHFTEDIGRMKAISAAEKLLRLDPELIIEPHMVKIDDSNAAALIGRYDITVSAVDNFETRQVINRACIRLNKPFIDGGVNGFRGTVMCVVPGITPCYHCIYGGMQRDSKKRPDVLGATAGAIGSMQAILAVRMLAEGNKSVPFSGIACFDGLSMKLENIEITRDENCPVCGKRMIY